MLVLVYYTVLYSGKCSVILALVYPANLDWVASQIIGSTIHKDGTPLHHNPLFLQFVRSQEEVGVFVDSTIYTY